MAVDCDFEIEGKSYSDSMIRDCIVFGTSYTKIRSKFIDEGGKLTEAKAIQMGQNYEYAQAQLKSTSGPVSTQEIHAVNQVKQWVSGAFQEHRRPRRCQPQNTTAKKKDKCTRCGYDAHPEDKNCPAMQKTCSLCSRKNHFAQCCKNKSKFSHSVIEVHCPLSSDDSCFFVETITVNRGSNQAFVSLSLGLKLIPV